ncbi:hypothetical protein AB0L39_33170 [Streptomyces parvus]|uniref:hypothetical protein n=1 Tax=Streptomyces parvus TaxID=66428 RepID=UPI003432F313
MGGHSHTADTSWVSTRIPRGTRQDSTQTVYVFERVDPAPIGAGRGWDEVMVAQSTPRAPMMCVAKVTVPERAAEPPVLRNSTVTFSHHRLSAAARCGALSVSAAGVAGGAGGFGLLGVPGLPGPGGDGLPVPPPPGFEGAEGSAGCEGASPGPPDEPAA